MKKNLNILYKNFVVLCFTFIFMITSLYAQNVIEDDNTETSQNNNTQNHFPIVVVDMQYIVSRSLAAVEVRNELDRLKKEYSEVVASEEEDLKILQDELGIQRPILPPDEFTILETDFRNKVEKLQSMIAEKNKELENILKKSINIIQNKTVQIITDVARERGLAVVLDTSTVVLAADSVNISKLVLESLNNQMPSIDLGVLKETSDEN